ncbi:MAG: winged helix-turn-helix domain-containing protein [Chloroflexi bacterium]|nr:winged helix-turn-helix domain-containing protein [Chloroflexota bacterium]
MEARWGIAYSYEGMRSVMKRQHLGLKVPRPQSEKADVRVQATWQKKLTERVNRGGLYPVQWLVLQR